MLNKKTAILIFDSFQNEKGKNTSFSGDKTLYKPLTQEVIKKVKLTGLDYYHATEVLQEGDTFGERFSNALASIYQKGYDNVITIGNDIPNLKTAHLLNAKNSLDNNEFILGPTFDGGFYLIGLQKDFFNASHFKGFSWNTSKIASEIKQFIKQFTSQVKILNYLHDIDSFSDLKKVYKTLSISQKELHLVIQKLIQTASKVEVLINNKELHFTVDILHNKGSPLISL